jgi:hypothetical protein
MKIATHHAKSERITSGIDVVKRFLLDRIALHSRDIPKGHAQFPILVKTNLADAPPALANETPVPASEASNPLTLFAPKRTHARLPVQHIGQGLARRAGCWRQAGWKVSSHKPEMS